MKYVKLWFRTFFKEIRRYKGDWEEVALFLFIGVVLMLLFGLP